jgi:pimeloyl-ACP methyl ester carboxylesterase
MHRASGPLIRSTALPCAGGASSVMLAVLALALAGPCLAGGARVAGEVGDDLSVQDSAGDSSAADGSAVVLIPSFMGCAYGYRHVVAELNQAGLRTVVVEPLGVGASPKPRDADYSLTAQAARIGAALDRRGVRQAIIVANGAAASLAFRLALARPGLVAGIVSLEGTPAETLGTPGMCKALNLLGLACKLGGQHFLRQSLKQALQGASGDAGWLDGLTFHRYYASFGPDVNATIATLQAMTKAEEPEALAPRLSRVKCPVILLVGEASHTGEVSEAEIARMQKALPDLSVRRLPGCGHYIMEERPAEVVAAVQTLAPRLLVSRAAEGETPARVSIYR